MQAGLLVCWLAGWLAGVAGYATWHRLVQGMLDGTDWCGVWRCVSGSQQAARAECSPSALALAVAPAVAPVGDRCVSNGCRVCSSEQLGQERQYMGGDVCPSVPGLELVFTSTEMKQLERRRRGRERISEKHEDRQKRKKSGLKVSFFLHL